jgi:tetratricopeptide (TPR) repeat protein
MVKKHLTVVILAIPLLLGLTGCTGGVNGEGTGTYSQDLGTPIVRGNAFNDAGWNYMVKGQYESAITQFNKVLADNPTADEKAEANNGIGWAKAKIGKLKDGMQWFAKAIDHSDDAKVGLAAAYIQMASKTDMEQVVELIYKQLGDENDHFKYTPRRETGISNAEVHAMLGYAFAALGEDEKARTQIEHAKELNPEWENTTIDQLISVVEFLIG